MSVKPHSMCDLLALFENLDGHSYYRYQQLCNKSFQHDCYDINFIHIQSSPGAFPASVCQLIFKIEALGLDGWCVSNELRQMATADYLLRAWYVAVTSHARQNRGVMGSGSFQPLN